jgi:hypothetical protein
MKNKRGVRAGKTARPAYRGVTDPERETVSSGDAPPKSDMMSDLPSKGLTLRGKRTNELSAKFTASGGYDYGDLDPGIVADAKAAATMIRTISASRTASS